MVYDDDQQNNLQQKVIDLFHQSIEAKMACGEMLAPNIEQASNLIVSRLLNEGKLFCCGNGTSANLASILAQNLSLQYKMERPGFPVILLTSDIATITARIHHLSATEIYSHKIDTLGADQDVLIVFGQGDSEGNIVRAIQAAHVKNMAVVCFTALGDEDITASLNERDCQLQVEIADQHRVNEIQLLSLYALCELIDYQIFGETI